MAKAIIALVASALCVLALAHAAEEKFDIHGVVYCDPCRIQFVTKLSKYLEGATVKLECKNRKSEKVTKTIEVKTDKHGAYKIAVQGDHSEDICQVKAVSSPDKDCNEAMDELARISISDNSGITSGKRFANPIGFMSKKASSECAGVLQEMGILA